MTNQIIFYGGRFLFKHFVKYAKEVGASSLELIVWEFNNEPIKFYEAMGMTAKKKNDGFIS